MHQGGSAQGAACCSALPLLVSGPLSEKLAKVKLKNVTTRYPKSVPDILIYFIIYFINLAFSIIHVACWSGEFNLTI